MNVVATLVFLSTKISFSSHTCIPLACWHMTCSLKDIAVLFLSSWSFNAGHDVATLLHLLDRNASHISDVGQCEVQTTDRDNFEKQKRKANLWAKVDFKLLVLNKIYVLLKQ